MKEYNYSHILLMKVGPYCGYDLDEIISIKKKEEKDIGMYFWGYSGVFCRPLVVKNLVTNANNHSVKVLFVETKSSFVPDTVERFNHFSKDMDIWEKLPKEVLLVGNNKKKHFAITAKSLKKVDFNLNLSEYCTLKGVFPNEKQSFDSYFRYRVDKACGVYVENRETEKKLVKIKYISELVSPYGIFIR